MKVYADTHALYVDMLQKKGKTKISFVLSNESGIEAGSEVSIDAVNGKIVIALLQPNTERRDDK